MSPGPDLDGARRLARELGGARVPRTVPVALERAGDLVLGVDVRAAGAVPVTDVSAMDGWAVAGPGPWRLLDGGVVDRLRAGEAAAVSTGAPLPRGATAVVRTERGRLDADRLYAADPAAGADLRRRGEELTAGDVVLRRGQVLTPLRLGLAAAAGADAVHVVVAPRTVLLVTGDELTDSGADRPGRTRDSLSHLLPPLLHRLGADVQRTARAGDDPAVLRDVFAGPYRGTVDLVVTTGGTAHGPADHVRRVLGEVRARTVVGGAAVRPGAPGVLATVPDGPVVAALPGNPLAAVAALLVLVSPWLDGWLGRPADELPRVELTGHRPAPHPTSTRLVPARLRPGRAGAVPTGHDGPGMLRGLAEADGFVALAPDGLTRWLPLP